MVVEDQHKIEDMLRELNDSKIKYRQLKEEYEEKNAKANVYKEEYESKLNNINQKEKDIIREAKEKATSILDEGRGLIERAVKDVRENQKSVSEIKKDFAEGSKSITPETPKEDEKKSTLRVGDIVRILDSNAVGEITEIHKDNVAINSNGLIIKSKMKKLVLVGVNNSNKESDYRIILKESFDTVLDIRGKYSNEIEELLENFIHEGHINNIGTLSVVHGKGTGSLRKSVHSMLKHNKFVSNFRLGNWNEGDTGVTIVELKS
jgi:DNA mismatch repair protein MutS2